MIKFEDAVYFKDINLSKTGAAFWVTMDENELKPGDSGTHLTIEGKSCLKGARLTWTYSPHKTDIFEKKE